MVLHFLRSAKLFICKNLIIDNENFYMKVHKQDHSRNTPKELLSKLAKIQTG